MNRGDEEGRHAGCGGKERREGTRLAYPQIAVALRPALQSVKYFTNMLGLAARKNRYFVYARWPRGRFGRDLLKSICDALKVCIWTLGHERRG